MQRTDSLLGGPLGRADIQMWHKPLTAVHNLFALETDHQNVTAYSKTDEYVSDYYTNHLHKQLISTRLLCHSVSSHGSPKFEIASRQDNWKLIDETLM
jgi:hypothetical protein